jgi:uncharacterized protein (TIGR00369 family)
MAPIFGLRIPFLELLGIRGEALEQGRAVVQVEIEPQLMNSRDRAHGGVIMTLLDQAMAAAARSFENGTTRVNTVSLSVNFIAAASGSLRGEGRVLRRGRSLVFCVGEVRDGRDTVVANATGAFKLVHRADVR